MIDFGACIGRAPPRSMPPLPVRWRRAAVGSSTRAPVEGGPDKGVPGATGAPGGGPSPAERGAPGGGGETRESWVPDEGGRGAGETEGPDGTLSGGGRGGQATRSGGSEERAQSIAGSPQSSCRAAITCVAATNPLRSDTAHARKKPQKESNDSYMTRQIQSRGTKRYEARHRTSLRRSREEPSKTDQTDAPLEQRTKGSSTGSTCMAARPTSRGRPGPPLRQHCRRWRRAQTGSKIAAGDGDACVRARARGRRRRRASVHPRHARDCAAATKVAPSGACL